MRVVGLDVGERRIGIAVSDPLGITAQPLETIMRDEGANDRIAAIVRDVGAERVVVGLPLLLDGSEGKQAALVREFAGALEGSLGIPVEFADERLTTRQAAGALKGEKLKPDEKKKAHDRVAAALILRGYLESRPEG